MPLVTQQCTAVTTRQRNRHATRTFGAQAQTADGRHSNGRLRESVQVLQLSRW